ncbi:MAG TPA: hypothetical protein VMM84_11765 [Pyrinomonadaceae bacterium]|nr:hypothetical protein [Pyrinomonadaceae bacterium]
MDLAAVSRREKLWLGFPASPNVLGAVICFFVMATLGACGGVSDTLETDQPPAQTQSNAAGPTKSDPCAIISQEEAGAILGEPVAVPKGQIVSEGTEKTAAVSQCTFAAAATPAKTFTILARRSPLKDNNPVATRKTLNEANIPTREISGVGDAAFWGSHQLHAFKGGDLYLVVSIFGIKDEAEGLDKAKAIAEKALNRL